MWVSAIYIPALHQGYVNRLWTKTNGWHIFSSRHTSPPGNHQTAPDEKNIFFMSDNTNNTPDKSSHFVSFSDIYILMEVYQENRAIRTHILRQVWERSKTKHHWKDSLSNMQRISSILDKDVCTEGYKSFFLKFLTRLLRANKNPLYYASPYWLSVVFTFVLHVNGTFTKRVITPTVSFLTSCVKPTSTSRRTIC